MASKNDIAELTYNNTAKTFRFTLSSPNKNTLILHHAPDGWADAETTYSRDKDYGSVFRNRSTNELTFYKEGRKFIKDVYEASGIDGKITLTVEKINKTTWAYESYPAANKIDLATYQCNEIAVMVQLMDTSFKEKIINRASTEVDILKTTSIEGYSIAAFTTSEITMPDTSITTASGLTENAGGFIVDLTHTVPIQLTGGGDFAEAQTPSITVPNIGTDAGSFFNSSSDNRLLVIDFDVQGSYIGLGALETYEVEVYVRKIDTTGATVTQYGVGTQSEDSDVGSTFSFQKSIAISLNTGDSLCLIGVINHVDQKFNYDTANVDINETYTGNPETVVTAYPYYETFLRICQIISDCPGGEEDVFYADFFGRTTPAASPLTAYGSDGGGSLGFVTKGLFFRDAQVISNTIPLSLKDFFDSLSAIYRLGLSIETIGGVVKVRVEELDTFFSATIVLDISSDLRAESIETHVIPDMFYKSGDFGYNKAEYENNAGLLEFNTKSTWTTVIKSVFNDIKKISKYRADGQGMRLIMLAPEAADYDPTKDVKGDSDIFLIDAVRNGSTYNARTNEGFDSITGSVYADESFNVRYSPGRNLRRWGASIKAGLLHNLNSHLRWQSSDKNTTLASKLTAESYTVTENEDVEADDLTDCRWLNEKFIVKAPITTVQLNAVDAAPNGLVKIADEVYDASGVEIEPKKYGWILEMKTTNKDSMAEFELLRCNLNIVTPV